MTREYQDRINRITIRMKKSSQDYKIDKIAIRVKLCFSNLVNLVILAKKDISLSTTFFQSC